MCLRMPQISLIIIYDWMSLASKGIRRFSKMTRSIPPKHVLVVLPRLAGQGQDNATFLDVYGLSWVLLGLNEGFRMRKFG